MFSPIEGEYHPSPVDGNSNSPQMPDALPFSQDQESKFQPQTLGQEARLRKFLRLVPPFLSLAAIALFAPGCDVIDPAIPVQAKGPETGSAVLYDPTLTSTPIPKKITPTEIYTPTLRITKTPRPTATMKPVEPSSTATVKPVEPSPTVTATVKAPEATPKVENDWTKGLFFTKEQIPEGAILLSRSTREKPNITEPGQVYYACDLSGIVKRNITLERYVVAMRFDLNQPNNNYCVPSSARLEDMQAAAAERYPTSKEKQQWFVNQGISLSRAFTDAVLAHKGIIYMDAFLGLSMEAPNDKLGWYTFDNPFPVPADYNWPLGKVLNIKLVTPSPTPIP